MPVNVDVEVNPRYTVEISKRDQDDFDMLLDTPALIRHLGGERDTLLSEAQIAHLALGMYGYSSVSRRWRMLLSSSQVIRDDLSCIYSGDMSSWLAVHHVIAMESDHECINGEFCTWYDIPYWSDYWAGNGRGRPITCSKEAYLSLHVLYILNWRLSCYPLYEAEGRLYDHPSAFDLKMKWHVSASEWAEWNKPVIVEEREIYGTSVTERYVGRSERDLRPDEGWVIHSPKWKELSRSHWSRRRLIGHSGLFFDNRAYDLVNSVDERLYNIREIIQVYDPYIHDKYQRCALSILPQYVWRMTESFKWSQCGHRYNCSCLNEEEARKKWEEDRESQGKHTVGIKIKLYSFPTAMAPPEDCDRLIGEARKVIKQLNELKPGRNVAELFSLFDALRAALNPLRPRGSHEEFRFQADSEAGGVIYWDGMYRKWFYLLKPIKRPANPPPPDKTYLAVLDPKCRPDDFKRKLWVAMDPDLRGRVLEGKITLTAAMKDLSSNRPQPNSV